MLSCLAPGLLLHAIPFTCKKKSTHKLKLRKEADHSTEEQEGGGGLLQKGRTVSKFRDTGAENGHKNTYKSLSQA